jgi:nucleolar GTP-binding protein
LLENDEWKHDKIPEVLNGQNVYDFIDPDIDAKLQALEEEEARLEDDGYYDDDEALEDAEEADLGFKAELIREKRQLIRNENKMRKSLKNRAAIPRSKKAVQMGKMESALQNAGYDTSAIAERARSLSRPRGRSRATTEDVDDTMDVDETPKERLARSISVARTRSQSAFNRREDGVTDVTSRDKAERMAKLGQKKMNRMARQGEGDRHTTASKSKWLLAGKRGMGSTRSR